jgi:hypothetical protein
MPGGVTRLEAIFEEGDRTAAITRPCRLSILESNRMRVTGILMVIVILGAGCATAAAPGSPSQSDATEGPVLPVLRLIDITPADGSPVDSSTVIVARLAYHIPRFDPDRTYVISAVFAGTEGRMFNRGGGSVELRSPVGIATVRHSLERLWTSVLDPPVTPLTGSFFLVERDSAVVDMGQPPIGPRLPMGTRMAGGPVRARTRTFYFNGAGPARTLAVGILDVLEEYSTYRSHKALAMAYESPGRWTYGYAFGHGSVEEASERALRECGEAAERRDITAPCRLIATDEEPVDP